MKIGILTLPLHDNYGGILQAVALYRYLHNHGHDVVLIYKDKHQVLWKKIIRWILLKAPFHNIKNIKTKYKLYKQWQDGKKFHRQFVEYEIFNISRDLYTKQDLENFSKQKNFDAIIVGSDQVWRKEYINDKYYKCFFLDFIDGAKTKKISYAASFGKDYWEGKDDHSDIAKLLKDFTAVSVRELSGVAICRNTFDYDKAVHVLDPTMLMNKKFYIDEIISKYDTSSICKGGLVTYVLDEDQEKEKIISFLKESFGLERVYHLKGFNQSKTTYSVPEWLSFFMNADFVVTDSFHGMVFSIIFEKDFIVVGNHDRGLDRFISLLSLLGLEGRLIYDILELKNQNLKNIDFNKVNYILSTKKTLSEEFLKIVLKKPTANELYVN